MFLNESEKKVNFNLQQNTIIMQLGVMFLRLHSLDIVVYKSELQANNAVFLTFFRFCRINLYQWQPLLHCEKMFNSTMAVVQKTGRRAKETNLSSKKRNEIESCFEAVGNVYYTVEHCYCICPKMTTQIKYLQTNALISNEIRTNPLCACSIAQYLFSNFGRRCKQTFIYCDVACWNHLWRLLSMSHKQL